MQNSKKAVLAAIVVLAVIAGAVIVYKLTQKSEPPPAPITEEKTPEKPASLGETIYEKVEPVNPAEQLPDTNPFDAETNPYKNAPKNPF